MTQIDLRKAPKGATHYRSGSIPWWANMNIGPYGALWRNNDWDFLLEPLKADGWNKIDLAWNGIGMPPIGSQVVVQDDGTLMYGQGESGEVLAHVEGCAVIRMSYGLGCFLPRVLFTPEQIAENERKKEIEILANIIYSRVGLSRDDTFNIASAIYEAGYQKKIAP